MRRSISIRRLTAIFAIVTLIAAAFYWFNQPQKTDDQQFDPNAVAELRYVWDVQTDPRITGASFVDHNGPLHCIDTINKEYGKKLDKLNGDQIAELNRANYPFTAQDAEAKAAKACGDRVAVNTYRIEMLRGKIIADENEKALYERNNPTMLPWQLTARLQSNKDEVKRLKEENARLAVA